MKTYEELLSDIEEDMELMGTSHIVYSAEENGVITDYDYLPSDLCMTSTTLKELQEKLGLSYLFISHDLDVVRWFCDEIAVMEEGKFVETGRTEDVIGHPKAEFTKKLVESFILE